jgi:hypothetical protein
MNLLLEVGIFSYESTLNESEISTFDYGLYLDGTLSVTIGKLAQE